LTSLDRTWLAEEEEDGDRLLGLSLGNRQYWIATDRKIPDRKYFQYGIG